VYNSIAKQTTLIVFAARDFHHQAVIICFGVSQNFKDEDKVKTTVMQ
jgi:hypothetical protein